MAETALKNGTKLKPEDVRNLAFYFNKVRPAATCMCGAWLLHWITSLHSCAATCDLLYKDTDDQLEPGACSCIAAHEHAQAIHFHIRAETIVSPSYL